MTLKRVRPDNRLRLSPEALAIAERLAAAQGHESPRTAVEALLLTAGVEVLARLESPTEK